MPGCSAVPDEEDGSFWPLINSVGKPLSARERSCKQEETSEKSSKDASSDKFAHSVFLDLSTAGWMPAIERLTCFF
jgi:hypothetical protein